MMSLEDSLYPMHIYSSIFAHNTVRFDRKINKITVCNYRITYNVTFGVVWFFLFVIAAKDLKIVQDSYVNIISEVGSIYELYSGVINQTCGIFLNIYYAKEIVRMIEKLRGIEKQFALIMEPINYRKLERIAYMSTAYFVWVFLFTFSTDMWLYYNGQNSMLYVLLTYLPILTTGAYKTQFTALMYCIAMQMAHLKRAFIDEHDSKLALMDATSSVQLKIVGNQRVYKLEMIHAIHNELCEVAMQLNQMYGFQVFLTAITSFAINLANGYYVYSRVVDLREDLYDLWLWLDFYLTWQWSTVQLIEVYILAAVCNYVQKEINTVKCIINDLICRCKEPQVLMSLKLFSLHEMHRRFQFTAWGLFTIDFTMFHMVVSMASMYLILTIQFDIGKTNVKN